MKIEGTYIAEVKKLREHAESKESPLIQFPRTQIYNKNSTLFQEVNNLKEVFGRKTSKQKS
jgi:hypothetical protein